jgi:hypothetical protein
MLKVTVLLAINSVVNDNAARHWFAMPSLPFLPVGRGTQGPWCSNIHHFWGFFATRGVLSHTADSLVYNFRKAFLPKHLLADKDSGGRPFTGIAYSIKGRYNGRSPILPLCWEYLLERLRRDTNLPPLQRFEPFQTTQSMELL